LVSFAAQIGFPRLHAPGRGIDHLLERDRLEPAIHKRDHRAELPRLWRADKLDGSIAEIARVLNVEWDRIGAAQLVPDLFVDHGGIQAEIGEYGLQLVFDHPREIDFAEP